MPWIKIILALSVALLVSRETFGQLNTIASAGALGPSAILINFEKQKPGAEATDLFSEWGITFLSGSDSQPRISSTFVVSVVNNVLRNETAGSSANVPLILNLHFPARRIGFNVSANDATQITIRGFDAFGNLLGTVQRSGLRTGGFLGVETNNFQGISKLIIDYGDTATPEQIDDLRIEFVKRPRFSTVLAQVGDGALPDGSLQTAIVISNLTNSTAQGELRTFDSKGNPLLLNLRGTTSPGGLAGTAFPLSIPAFSSITFVTTGATLEPKLGYATIQSSVPIEGTALFQVLDLNQRLVSEAGVSIASPKVFAVGVVRRFQLDSLNSGIAAANTSDARTDGRIALLDESGVEVAVNEEILDLNPGHHIADFLNEIFPGVPEDFRGTVLISSAKPLAVVILRTRNGVPISSLPVGSTQK